MRISSGVAKGRLLKVPKIPGIRLTTELVRNAVFSILSEKVLNSVCLDLFAGSGSIGIEALSRGAKWCDLVDINPEAVEAINQNLKECGFELSAKAFTQDSLKYVTNYPKKYDIIFMDPYYDQVTHKHLFKVLPEIMNSDGYLVLLSGNLLQVSKLIEGSTLKLKDQRKYGVTFVSFLGLT